MQGWMEYRIHSQLIKSVCIKNMVENCLEDLRSPLQPKIPQYSSVRKWGSLSHYVLTVMSLLYSMLCSIKDGEVKALTAQFRLMASPGTEVWLVRDNVLTFGLEIKLKSQCLGFKKIHSTWEGGREIYFSSRLSFPLWNYWIFILCIFSSCQIVHTKCKAGE